ncbi:MAG: DUF4430 domain-containing protein [bacterium]|nr:DUF4430 domain-containing protein [bacterium]
MKTKSLIFIFILCLLIVTGGLAVFSNEKQAEPAVSERPDAVELDASSEVNESTVATSTVPEKNATSQTPLIREEKNGEAQQIVEIPAEEKIKAVTMIDGVKFAAEIKTGATAHDLMNELKAENKINFSGKNYPGLGFFVEEINGLKNNSSGKNWVYYVNGRPAPVGVSNYILKDGDIIEWKYEEKSF